MWFITLDPEVALSEFTDATKLVPTAILEDNNIKIIFKLHEKIIYTNIPVNEENLMIQESSGLGSINGDIKGISLYIKDSDYAIADLIMNYLHQEVNIRSIMMQI